MNEELGDEAPEVLFTMLSRAIGAARAASGLVDDYDISEQDWRSACHLVGTHPAEA